MTFNLNNLVSNPCGVCTYTWYKGTCPDAAIPPACVGASNNGPTPDASGIIDVTTTCGGTYSYYADVCEGTCCSCINVCITVRDTLVLAALPQIQFCRYKDNDGVQQYSPASYNVDLDDYLSSCAAGCNLTGNENLEYVFKKQGNPDVWGNNSNVSETAASFFTGAPANCYNTHSQTYEAKVRHQGNPGCQSNTRTVTGIGSPNYERPTLIQNDTFCTDCSTKNIHQFFTYCHGTSNFPPRTSLRIDVSKNPGNSTSFTVTNTGTNPGTLPVVNINFCTNTNLGILNPGECADYTFSFTYTYLDIPGCNITYTGGYTVNICRPTSTQQLNTFTGCGNFNEIYCT